MNTFVKHGNVYALWNKLPGAMYVRTGGRSKIITCNGKWPVLLCVCVLTFYYVNDVH